MSGKWITVKIPRELYELAKKAVEDSRLGYTSTSDFITDAIRIRLRELGYLP